MPVRISGLGSGLDIESLVNQMMTAKRVPINSMKQKLTALEWQRDAYRGMNTDMSAFMKEVQKLTLQTTMSAKKSSMSVTDADKVQVSPTASAFTGNFSLQVSQLAKAATITSGTVGVAANPTQAIATANATLQITGGTGTTPQTINIANGDNISQIVSKINAVTSQTGVKAAYDQLSDKLTLVSAQTGSTSGVQIQETTATPTDLLNKLKLTATGVYNTGMANGQNAIVNLNGGGNIQVQNNSFTLNNINFTLLADPNGTPYTVSGSINQDVDQIVSTIKGVFDKYNELINKVNGKLTEPKYRNYLPLTDDQKKDMKDADIALWEEKAKSGLLRGDSILSSGLNKMRQILSSSVTGIPTGQYKSLADIGITTAPSDGKNNLAYMENGKIYIDETKLRKALTDAPDQVTALFTKDGARDANGKLTTWTDAGIGTQLYELLNTEIISSLTEKTQIVPSRSYLNTQIDDYTSRIGLAESNLNNYEQSLYSKYSQMEAALNKLNSQGSQLASFFQSK